MKPSRPIFRPKNWCASRFLPEGKTVEFEYGAMPYDHHGKPMSFLDVAENHDIFLDHACGGACACTTCHIWVKDGGRKISEADDDELDRLDMAADQQLNSRLGCQAVITAPRQLRGRDSQVEPQLCLRRQAAGVGRKQIMGSHTISGWDATSIDLHQNERKMPREIHWTDAEEIGIQLQEKFPEIDPLTVRFTDLHRYVTELEGFADDPIQIERGEASKLSRWRGTRNSRTRGDDVCGHSVRFQMTSTAKPVCRAASASR